VKRKSYVRYPFSWGNAKCDFCLSVATPNPTLRRAELYPGLCLCLIRLTKWWKKMIVDSLMKTLSQRIGTNPHESTPSPLRSIHPTFAHAKQPRSPVSRLQASCSAHPKFQGEIDYPGCFGTERILPGCKSLLCPQYEVKTN
jgi:hypothetical protein